MSPFSGDTLAPAWGGVQKTCNDYLTASQLESGFGSGGVNIYDIFADVCGADREVAVVRQFARVLGTTPASAGPNGVANTASLAAAVSLPTPGKYPLKDLPSCANLTPLWPATVADTDLAPSAKGGVACFS